MPCFIQVSIMLFVLAFMLMNIVIIFPIICEKCSSVKSNVKIIQIKIDQSFKLERWLINIPLISSSIEFMTKIINIYFDNLKVFLTASLFWFNWWVAFWYKKWYLSTLHTNECHFFEGWFFCKETLMAVFIPYKENKSCNYYSNIENLIANWNCGLAKFNKKWKTTNYSPSKRS